MQQEIQGTMLKNDFSFTATSFSNLNDSKAIKDHFEHNDK